MKSRRTWAVLMMVLAGAWPGSSAESVGAPAPPPPTAFSCIMHVHSAMSSGRYSLRELTAVASTQNVDAIFLSDSLTESLQFGILPLRHVFWLSRHRPSILTTGIERYLDAVREENLRQSRVLFVPGMELMPRYYWTGSLFKATLTVHNHQRNLIVLGADKADDYRAAPVSNGFLPGIHDVWIAATRLLPGLFVLLILGLPIFPEWLARRSLVSRREWRRRFVWALLVVGLISIPVNGLIANRPWSNVYGGEQRNEQRVLDYLRQRGLVHFWAHPEASDRQDFSFAGIPFRAETEPYPEMLTSTRGAAGFAGLNEGENRLVEAGSRWDQALLEYLDGRRTAPVWCFGEMLYHYENQAGKRLSNVETMIWSREKTQASLLASLRNGSFYARQNHAGRSLTLEDWRINDVRSGGAVTGRTTAVTIALSVSESGAPEPLKVELIRNGKVIRTETLQAPAIVTFTDELSGISGPLYYRAVVSGKYPVKLVTNPIFVEKI